MVGFKHTLCALLLTMVTGTAIAQNNTNSMVTCPIRVSVTAGRWGELLLDFGMEHRSIR